MAEMVLDGMRRPPELLLRQVFLEIACNACTLAAVAQPVTSNVPAGSKNCTEASLLNVSGSSPIRIDCVIF